MSNIVQFTPYSHVLRRIHVECLLARAFYHYNVHGKFCDETVFWLQWQAQHESRNIMGDRYFPEPEKILEVYLPRLKILFEKFENEDYDAIDIDGTLYPVQTAELETIVSEPNVSLEEKLWWTHKGHQAAIVNWDTIDRKCISILVI